MIAVHAPQDLVAIEQKVDAQPGGATTRATALSSVPSAASATPTPAAAARARGELALGVGLEGGSSDWTGDPLAYGSGVMGLRILRVVRPYFGLAVGYARVDQRVLTRLTIGVSLSVPIADRFFPRVYVALVHQHEESLAALAQQAFGAILGIGTGIRHRAGVHMGLGFDVQLYRNPSTTLSLGPDLSAMYLTYSSGPAWYFTAGALLTGHFRMW